MLRAQTVLKWLLPGVAAIHGTDMDVWQGWIYGWRNTWPTRLLAAAVEEFVPTPSSDPIVGAIQTLLAELGYTPGPADGLAGPRTKAAIIKFQHEKRLHVTGEATDTLRVAACAELRRRSFPPSDGPSPL